MSELTHFDKNGNAVMVDVSQKNETERIATACSSISISKETLECIKNNQKMTPPLWQKVKKN